MADVSKRLEKAEKYLQKGKMDSALDEYIGILNDEPNHEGARSAAADICINLNRPGDAAKLLGPLFDRQASIGDIAKANITYKKLQRFTTPTMDQALRFGQLVEKTAKKDALDAYELAITGLAGAGRKPDAMKALQRVVALDPSVNNYTRLGEMAAELLDAQTASEAFFQVGELETKAGRDAASWYERAFSTNRSNAHAALAHGRAVLAKGDAPGAVKVVEALARAADASGELREIYCKALLAAKRPIDAEPYVWELLDKDPKQADEVGEMIGGLIDLEKHDKALEAAHRLEQHQAKHDRRREFASIMKTVSDKHAPDTPFLQYLVEIYNSTNREQDYCATLVKLFKLYFAAGNFLKAADSLDAAAEVDPYEPGHHKNLEMLRGKIEPNRFNAVANRFMGAVKVEEDSSAGPVAAGPGAEGETTILEDLMLQAEIFLQYSMRSKAVERLQRIQKLFPREEEKSEKLRQLYLNAGIAPKYEDGGPPAPAAAPARSTTQTLTRPAAVAAASRAAANESAMDNIGRVTEITRNIYRQGNVKSVLFTAVNDIGRHWNASRCVAGLCTPGKPPSAALEYCAPGVRQSDVIAIVKRIGALQALVVSHQGPVTIPNVPTATELASVKQYLSDLQVQSILAVPLLDGEENAGILLLEQCEPREWGQSDVFVLKTIADQMVLAVNNSKLRSLVKTLAVTDEKSGLLRRSSYLDVLLSEVRRAVQQKSTAAIMLLQFAKPGLAKEVGEPAVENLMQQVGQVITSHIRQNDVAVRYDLTTIALVLSETTEKNSFFVVDKLRKVMDAIKMPGSGDKTVPVTAGIAEIVAREDFDPVDIVTEVINRAEQALELAKSEGGNKAHALAPRLETAAMA